MQAEVTYDFSATLWQHETPGGWHFVSLPKDISTEIREHFQWQEEGWGRMKAVAKINELKWETSIWFDTKRNAYILPIKAEIRKKQNYKVGDEIHLQISM